jgi:NAD(P)-dependent dehydrogenase (short-subunit alcohol dehydrogenase family)
MLKEDASTTRDSTVNVRQLFDLSGRVAIVTGGSIGLGRQMAEGLAEMGAHVVLCARKQERCHQAAEELQQLGVKAIALSCDVKNPDSVQEMVEATLSQFGRIDVLINNAGISWGAPVEEMRLEDWNKVIETNLTGTFLCAQAVGKVMIRQGRGENGAGRNSAGKSSAGKIINIASVAGLGGAPAELPAIGYHASKGGVISFTKDLACKWASHNIQVNAIAPGWFPTHMSNRVLEHYEELFLSHIPLRRFGNEHDLKGAAVFLASDASNYVTGHVLVVDGGQSAW